MIWRQYFPEEIIIPEEEIKPDLCWKREQGKANQNQSDPKDFKALSLSYLKEADCEEEKANGRKVLSYQVAIDLIAAERSRVILNSFDNAVLINIRKGTTVKNIAALEKFASILRPQYAHQINRGQVMQELKCRMRSGKTCYRQLNDNPYSWMTQNFKLHLVLTSQASLYMQISLKCHMDWLRGRPIREKAYASTRW